MTTTIKYTDMLSEVLPHLAADPSQPLVEAAIRNAVIEFCAQSWIWRHYPDAIDVEAGESSYDLEPPAGADVATILSAKYDNDLITSLSTDGLDQLLPNWATEAGTVKYYTQIDTESIILAPLPDSTVAGGLVLILALQPRRTASSFPKWISAQYMEELASGALARLMLMASKPWSDAKAGEMHQKRFGNAIAAARSSGVHGLSRAVIRTTPQH